MSVHGGGGHPHHGGRGGFRGRGGFLGFWPYPYPCDPLYDPACPYIYGEDLDALDAGATDLHARGPGSMSPVGSAHNFGDEFHSRPAGSMVPVGCAGDDDWRMKL